MESTLKKRIWHKGPPPHVGWWQASMSRHSEAWRWWNGSLWSRSPHLRLDSSEKIAYRASLPAAVQGCIEWNDYWPEDARVPRIDPAVGYTHHDGELWIITPDGEVHHAPRGHLKPPDSLPLGDSGAWLRWAESRNHQAQHARDVVKSIEIAAGVHDPLGLASRVNTALPPDYVERLNKAYPPKRSLVGSTRMVDGLALEQIALDAEELARQIRAVQRNAS